MRRGNRLPDAVLVSHPHFDHYSGLDWLVSSFERTRGSPTDKLPVYASAPCWEVVRSRFFYLTDSIEWRELNLGQVHRVPESMGTLELVPFPVYHGPSAPGAVLLLVQASSRGPTAKAIYTGDVLCPLLRQEDYLRLSGAQVLYADACTRFPSPASGHWSIARSMDAEVGPSRKLSDWMAEQSGIAYRELTRPHLGQGPGSSGDRLLCEFVSGLTRGEQKLCCSVLDFARRIAPQNVKLVHYSGYEEEECEEPALTDPELLEWVNKVSLAAGSTAVWTIPAPGDCFLL